MAVIKTKCAKEGCDTLTGKQFCMSHSKKVKPCRHEGCTRNGKEEYCSHHTQKTKEYHRSYYKKRSHDKLEIFHLYEKVKKNIQDELKTEEDVAFYLSFTQACLSNEFMNMVKTFIPLHTKEDAKENFSPVVNLL